MMAVGTAGALFKHPTPHTVLLTTTVVVVAIGRVVGVAEMSRVC